MLPPVILRARSWWQRARPLGRREVLAYWPHCASWSETQAVLARVVPWQRADAQLDLIDRAPACWPDLVTTAIQSGPSGIRQLLLRADCPEAEARRAVAALPRDLTLDPPERFRPDVAEALAGVLAHGWALAEIDPPRWRSLVEILSVGAKAYWHKWEWHFVLSSPRVSPADWAAMIHGPVTPNPFIDADMLRRLLGDPRSTPDDRRRLLRVGAPSVGALTDRVLRPMARWWSHAGIVAGLCDQCDQSSSPAPTQHLADLLWDAFAAAGSPDDRQSLWLALEQGDSPGRTLVVDALWDRHGAGLLTLMADATPHFLLMGGNRTRLAVLLAAADQPAGGTSALTPHSIRLPRIPAR